MTAAVVLAAGASSRMGVPKASLPWHGVTLLERAVSACRDAGCDPVTVVLGCHPLDVPAGATAADNPDWRRGMGSSIAAGVRATPVGRDVLILPCDLPRVAAADLRRLILALAGRSAAAASFAGTLGPPACFAAALRPQLLELSAAGAKALLRRPDANVAAVPMPAAAWDIDTPQDFRRVTAD